jgi:hypothetical protein
MTNDEITALFPEFKPDSVLRAVRAFMGRHEIQSKRDAVTRLRAFHDDRMRYYGMRNITGKRAHDGHPASE